MNSRLREALRTVFMETGAESIEVHSGDREPGEWIRRDDVVERYRPGIDGPDPDDPHERQS